MTAFINQKDEVYEQPFRLITFDDFTIQCKMIVSRMFIKMPDYLRYDKTDSSSGLLERSECVFFMQAIVS